MCKRLFVFVCVCSRLLANFVGERQSIAQKDVCAIDARNSQLETAQVPQKPVFALPGCQWMSVSTFCMILWGLLVFACVCLSAFVNICLHLFAI